MDEMKFRVKVERVLTSTNRAFGEKQHGKFMAMLIKLKDL